LGQENRVTCRKIWPELFLATSTPHIATHQLKLSQPPLFNWRAGAALFTMSVYDEIEIEDMTFDETLQIYHYPCPCGDRFEIAIDDLRDGEEIAVCPSCSLTIKVIFEPEDLPEEAEPEPQNAQQVPMAA